MIIGMDRTPRDRIWGCWTGTGNKKEGYFLLATSDDDGVTWSKPRLAVGRDRWFPSRWGMNCAESFNPCAARPGTRRRALERVGRDR